MTNKDILAFIALGILLWILAEIPEPPDKDDE